MNTRILDADEILKIGDVVYMDGRKDITINGLAGKRVNELVYYEDDRIRVERRVDEVLAAELTTLRVRVASLEAECAALRTELISVLKVSITRGETLGYEDDDDRERLSELKSKATQPRAQVSA